MEQGVLIGGEIAMDDYLALESVARRYGLVTKKNGRVNISAALRVVIKAGLDALKEGRSETADHG